ncbi:MAG: Spy/CpxP family protein refolding chaperone [Candidatus Omnitrophota bacterium]
MKLHKFGSMTVIGVVAALFLVSAAYAGDAGCATGQCPKDGKKMEVKRQEMFKDLNLTDAQRTALQENRERQKEGMKAMFAGMKEKRGVFRQELEKEPIDMGKVNQIHNEIKQLQGQMADQRLAGILEVRKVLTPEQFKKFMARMDEKMEQHKDKRGKEKDKE